MTISAEVFEAFLKVLFWAKQYLVRARGRASASSLPSDEPGAMRRSPVGENNRVWNRVRRRGTVFRKLTLCSTQRPVLIHFEGAIPTACFGKR